MTNESERRVLRLALAAALALLLAHAAFYRFLCDDAFISFRYAHNLAQGDGLVFNPGHERVEGYTNFLWVVLLAACDGLGWAPESAAPSLSLALTAALWLLVARASWRLTPGGPWRWVVPLPALWLALTRSVAVWSTSGLETRLFEVLVVAGVLHLIEDVHAADGGRPRKIPWGAVLLALGALTRPDGLLIGGAVMAATAGVLLVRRRLDVKDVLRHAAVFGGIVGAHLLFRHAYYGEWVPNTYFAKVGGRSWWGMGAAYIACFAIEYAAWIWIPAVIAGVQGFVLDRRAEVPTLVGAVIVPHALYVASIGGDHFEFRPLDLYFPLVFVLMGRGLAALLSGVLPRWGAVVYATLIAIGLIAIPWRSHVEFTHDYAVGFPGLGSTRGERLAYLDPGRNPLYRWPGLRVLGAAHRELLRTTTSRLVGVRQEEHALFLGTVTPEGRRLRALVEAGTLPADTHVAISAVGAIPYYSGLRTLDRLGLTDAVVAKSAPGELRIMAHDRHATLDYAERAGVDLWSEHPVHLLTRVDDDNLVWRLEQARAEGSPVYFADAGEGDFAIARLPQGIERTAARFPRLTFHAAADEGAYAALLDAVIEAQRAAVAREPRARDRRLSLGSALTARGRVDEALPIFRGLAEEGDADGWYNLGTVQARRGQMTEAIDAFRSALQIDPGMGPARHNLGLVLARSGRVDDAVVELREAVRLEPDSDRALYTLGAALVLAGDIRGAAECAARIEANGTIEGAALAARLRGAIPAD
jgi:arabinofuranosyltransferase